jgi:glycosyltransferase involved in cell wall biosynthesis
VPIVHLVSRPAAGGIRTHLAGLLDDLPDAHWTPILYAPVDLLASLSSRLVNNSSFPLQIPPNLSFSDIRIARQLASQLPKDALVHAHGIRAAWICVLGRRFAKFSLIVTLHNVPPVGIAGQLAQQIILKASEKIICVSQYIADGLPSDKVVVIPNGVDCELPCNRKPTDSFTVLCASRMSPEKGVDLLLEAAKLLPDVSFILAGDGPLRTACEAKAPQNVQFLGKRDDVHNLLLKADCLVLPSRSEGQGLSVLEAFAAGTPVVATKVGGVPENVVDGYTGILVDPENAEALAKALKSIRDDPQRATILASNAGKWVREHRRRQTQSAAIAKLYGELRPDD